MRHVAKQDMRSGCSPTRCQSNLVAWQLAAWLRYTRYGVPRPDDRPRAADSWRAVWLVTARSRYSGNSIQCRSSWPQRPHSSHRFH